MSEGIEEIRRWNEEFGPQQVGIKSAVDTLFAEIDALRARITGLTQGWEADRVELVAQRERWYEKAVRRVLLLDRLRRKYPDMVPDIDEDGESGLESALSRCRADALEEAARVVHRMLHDERTDWTVNDVYDAIHSLQTTPPSPSYAAGTEAVFTAGAIFGWDACENNWQEDDYESRKAEAIATLHSASNQ